MRIAFSEPHALEEASAAWLEASRRLFDSGSGSGTGGDSLATPPVEGSTPRDPGKPFEDEESFLEELLRGSPERASLAFERLLARLPEEGPTSSADFFRIAGLFCAAYRGLARRGLISYEEAESSIDASDLASAQAAGRLAEAARERFALLSERMGRSPKRSAPVVKAIAFIQENYGRQISLELAADSVGLSPGRLSRLFVEETGRGFSDYLIEYRILKAREALRLPDASIKQVSLACGYPDPNYFSRLFKKITGLTPSSFSSGAVEAEEEAEPRNG